MGSTFRLALLLAALAVPAAPGAAQICAGPVGNDPFANPNLVIATGGRVYVTGSLGNHVRIARLDGDAWTVLPGAFVGSVQAIADTAFGLVAGGRFTSVDGLPVARIARLAGDVWVPLGTGVSGVGNVEVRALEEHGGLVYAAGVFASAGGIASANVAAFDGAQWVGLAGGTNGGVEALESHAGALVAAGAFTAAGGASIANVAGWDGAAWSAVGSPLPAVVDLAASGNRLYAAAGGNLHLLSGATWQPTGDPTAVDVRRVAVSGDTVMVQGAWNALCITWGGGPCLIRARYQGGVWTQLFHDEDAPSFASLSIAGQDGAFFDTGGTSGLFEHSPGPKLDAAFGVGAWYEQKTLTLHGSCIDPVLPIAVRLGDHPPLVGVYQPSNKVAVTVPAGWLDAGDGSLDLTLEQGGYSVTLSDAYQVQPYLRTQGTIFVLVTANFWVDTPVHSGKAWAFVAASTSPVPLSLPGVAGPWLLDLASTNFVMWGNLHDPSFAEVHVAAPPGSVPPGLVVPAQALVLEDATPLGPVLSFTNVSMLQF